LHQKNYGEDGLIKLKKNEKRYAITSAISATGVTALVMARGHRIDRISEVPLVVSDDIQSYQKTKQALEFLKRVKAIDDVIKVKKSVQVRAGKGKARGRRTIQKKGPLIVFSKNNGIVNAFRNIKGVDVCAVNNLNLLQLAPGGHVGRFVIWTESAFKELSTMFGSYDGKVTAKINKKRDISYQLPRPMMINTDIPKLTSSDEIQSVKRPWKGTKRQIKRKNPLKNFYAMVKLNPFALTLKRLEVKKKEKQAKYLELTKTKNFKPSVRTLKIEKREKENEQSKKKFFEKIFNFENENKQ